MLNKAAIQEGLDQWSVVSKKISAIDNLSYLLEVLILTAIYCPGQHNLVMGNSLRILPTWGKDLMMIKPLIFRAVQTQIQGIKCKGSSLLPKANLLVDNKQWEREMKAMEEKVLGTGFRCHNHLQSKIL